MTPPHFFDGIDAEAVRRAEHGLRQAVRLAKSKARFWVDSAFNGRELTSLAFGIKSDELPPFHQAERLVSAAPDAPGGADDWATTFLCVGRIAPNKNLTAAVETLAAYRAKFNPHARLILAGDHIFPAYSDRVRRRVTELGLADAVAVTGRVTLPQLKGLVLIG